MVFNSKKGWFDVVLLAILLIFAFGIVTMFIGNLYDSINTELQEDSGLTNSSKEMVDSLNNRYPLIMDGAFVLVMVLFYLLCLFVSYNSTDSSFLKVLAIVIMILLVVTSIILGSFYDDLSDDDSISSSFSSFTFTNWALGNFGVLTLIFIASMIGMMAIGGRNNAF